ncbi:MAG TPA: hypothetical protein VGM18_09875 [Candidatus Sulfotelmatobacter sp.]|jgi:hypothetical protein
MSQRKNIWILGMLVCALCGAWAQDTSTPPAGEPAPQTTAPQTTVPQSSPQEPVPAYGQENPPPPVSDNPPLSGLDLPSLEPHAAPLSYIQPGATFSESADSNAGDTAGGSAFSSITRGIGSATLKRLWSHYDLAMDYAGGVAYYTLRGIGWKTLQQMDLDQKVTWKRGQLSLRDSFSYLPEGNFGSSYGSTGSQGISSLGTTAFGSFFGGSSLGALGQVSRMTNVSLADVSESLTPKSSITVAGGYAFTHFYGSDQSTGVNFIGSSQTSGQVGYNRTLTTHTQIALVYGYQAFDFSVFDTAFHSHVIQGMYGHRITGRMDLLIGAGPQITLISSCPFFFSGVCLSGTVPNTKLGVAGQFRLRYKFTRTSLDLRYERFETSGSGVFAGAQSDIARVTANRPLSRIWSGFADIGYAHNVRLQGLTQSETATCNLPGQSNPSLPPCPGVDANAYSFGFAGVGVHRPFGREFHGYTSYQFSELSFDRSYCGTGAACGRISNRNVFTVGLDWTPRPIRID